MALSDKDIIITPNKSQTADPKIEFRGADSSTGAQTITVKAYPTNGGTLSFEGSSGQLFAVTNSLTGTLFSVNDISGVPSIEVLDTGFIKLAQYGGTVGIGVSTSAYNDKLQIANPDSTGIRFTGSNATITSNYNLIGVASNNIYLRPASVYSVIIDSGTGLYVSSGNITWAPGSQNNGNPRSLAIGYSGGNYGQTGYGITFTGTSGLHNYAINDIVSLWEAYDGIRVYAAAAGTVGTAITWTTVLDARRSNSALTFKGNTVLDSNNYSTYASPLAGSGSITTVGTITSGTWNGSIIGSVYGGTGVNNAGRTLTINTNSGTISFTNASTTLTVANTASVSGTNTGDQTIGNGTLSLGVSGNGLSGSASFTANQSGAGTFTVTSNATSSNTYNTIVYRDGSGNFAAGTITADLSGTATYAGMISGNIAAGTSKNIVDVTVGDNDFFRITAGSTSSNAGYVEFATSDDGTEPIRFSQSGIRTLTLLDSSGNTSIPGTLTVSGASVSIAGNTAIHAGNYNSYAPTLTGTGASGTWGISINGNAATATSADQIDGVPFRNSISSGPVNADNLDSNGITYYTSGVTNFSGNSTDGALYSQAYSSSWQHQIAGDYRSGQIALRGKNSGTWQSWRTVLDSTNYTSYVGNGTLTLAVSGSGLSGSASFTANQSGNTTFTVTSNATSSNTANTIVLRDGSGNIFGQEIYASGWFRSYGYQGIYNQDYQTHFYAGGTGYYNLAGNSSATNGGLSFRFGHQSTLKGQVYWDSAGFGLLNDSGNWAVRSNYGSQWAGGSIYGAWLKTSANNTGGITVPGVFIQSGVTSGAPTAIQSGDLWWNTDTGKLKIYWSSASAWVDATPVPDMAGYYTTAGGNINGNVNVNGLLESTGNINARVGQTHSISLGTHPSYGASWVGLWRTGSDYALITNSNNTLLNAPTGSIGFRVANSEYAYVNSSGVTTNGSFIMSGGFTLSQVGAYGQTNNWIHLNGWHGIYSTNNGAHFFPNQSSSYGSWETRGSRNSWGGIWDNYSGVNWMHQTDGSGGLYKESNGRWYIYHNTTHNCTAIGGSSTDSAYRVYLNGNNYVSGYERIGGGNLYIDGNYGRGVVGLYDSYRYQGVFAMGDSYKLADNGTTTGTLYGIAWSHPNAGGAAANLASHGMLILENGTFKGAWGGGRLVTPEEVRGTKFVDYNNTNYYCDPDGTSVLNGLTIGGNTAIHAGNYNSYAPTLTGGGASGTWSINVTGSAGLVAWSNVSGRPTWMTVTNLTENLSNFNNSRPSGFYQGSSATNAPTASTWYNLINVRHDNVNNDHGFQLAMSYYSNVLYHRHYQGGTGQNDGNFSAWATVLSDQNYTSYVGNGTLTLNVSGTGLSGSASFTANQSGNTTFTVTSNATSSNTGSTIVARDGNGDFAARIAVLDGYVRNNGSVADDDGFGMYWSSDASNAYAIYREAGGWASPFPDLRIAFHTGIKLGANASYNGIRFYNDYDMATQVMSVNNGSDGLGANNVYVNNSLQAGSSLRAPIFYDSADATYYVDPATDSRLNGAIRFDGSLGVGTAASGTPGEIRATNNITAYYSDDRLKTKLGIIENPIEKVKSLSGFYFEANETAVALGYQKKREVGVSAQEVQAILPEIIAPAPIDEQYMTVRYEKLIPLLIEAIKAQQAQIEELQKLIKEKV